MKRWADAIKAQAPQEDMVMVPHSDLAHLIMVENAAKNFVSVMADFSGKNEAPPFAHLVTDGDYPHAIVMQALSELCTLVEESWEQGRVRNGIAAGGNMGA